MALISLEERRPKSTLPMKEATGCEIFMVVYEIHNIIKKAKQKLNKELTRMWSGGGSAGHFLVSKNGGRGNVPLPATFYVDKVPKTLEPHQLSNVSCMYHWFRETNMDEIGDVDMPSPKRVRVQAAEQLVIHSQSESLDDFDDIYGTPPKVAEEQIGSVLLPAFPTTNTASMNSRTLLSLPGLGLFQNEVTPSNGVAPSDTQKSPQTVLQDSIPAASVGQQGSSEHLRLEQKTNSNADTTNPSPDDLLASLEQRLVAMPESDNVIWRNEKTEAQVHKVAIPLGASSRPVDVEMQAGEKPETQKLKRGGEAAGLDNVSGSAEKVKHHGRDLFPQSSPAFPDMPQSLSTIVPQAASLEDSSAQAKGQEDKQDPPTLEPTEDVPEAESHPKPEAPSFDNLATANKSKPGAEYELDSDPPDSSDSDSSDDTSSDDDEADDYQMLDPEEMARRLMGEEGGSDDETAWKHKAPGPLRTQNEKPDDDVPKPDVVVTEDMRIQELGPVEGVVENLVLIKAKTSGEYQVLEQGSVLCLEDKSVIGAIAETLGRVQQPYYSVRFTNEAAIADAGIAKDTRIFFVEQYSTPVFTQPLKAFKGSDASNLHDEEVGDDELEFSDDEAEAEHRKSVKMQKQARRAEREGQSNGFSRGPRGGRGGMRGGRGGGRGSHNMSNGMGYGMPEIHERVPNPAEAGLNYDDPQEAKMDEDDLYTPLARPSNLHEMTGAQSPPTETPAGRWNNDRGGRGRGRGRGDRGSGRGAGRGRGRGGFDRGGQNSNYSNYNQSNGYQQHSGSASNTPSGLPDYQPPQSNGFPPPPSAPSQNQNPSNPYTGAMPSQQQSHPPVQPQYAQDWYKQQFFQQQYNPYQNQPQGNQQQQQSQAYSQPPFAPNAAAHASANIPPGAHVNPAFFARQQQGQSQNQQNQQQWPPGGPQQ